MTTPRSRLIREKNSLQDQLYKQQAQSNIYDKILGFVNQYITEGEEKRRFDEQMKLKNAEEVRSQKTFESQYGAGGTVEQELGMKKREHEVRFGVGDKEGLEQQESKSKQAYYSGKGAGQPKYYKVVGDKETAIIKIDESGAKPIYTVESGKKIPLPAEILKQYIYLKNSTDEADIAERSQYENWWPELLNKSETQATQPGKPKPKGW